jgi:hypothetical protein
MHLTGAQLLSKVINSHYLSKNNMNTCAWKTQKDQLFAWVPKAKV